MNLEKSNEIREFVHFLKTQNIKFSDELITSYEKAKEIEKMNKTKELGQVFTPDYVVDLILDDVGYKHNHIIGKKIMEPSFGNGVFLLHIVKRLISECELSGMNKSQITQQLENNVYGIEIDEECFNRTIQDLNNFVKGFGLENINWNLFLMDTLQYKNFNYFDYVVGNPPYIRVHNLSESNRQAIKDFAFSKGTTDMYIVFFEIGLKMLKQNGKLGYITPNSYIANTSQKAFRKFLLEKNLIRIIENYESWKVFNNADTYTCITILDAGKTDTEFTYSSIEKTDRKFITLYDINDFKNEKDEFDGKPWKLTNQKEAELLKQIEQRQKTIENYATVQYGFATNKDSVYISKTILPTKNKNIIIFNNYEIEKQLIKKVVKGSKFHGEGNYYILFPYHDDKKTGTVSIIKEEEMSSKYPLTHSYLLAHKSELIKRDMDTNFSEWYQFARSQGLSNCFKKKLVINHIVSNNQENVEVYELPEDTFVYSGIYITAPDQEKLNYVKEQLSSNEFCQYAKLCGKDMSCGYKTFNTKTVKEYHVEGLKDEKTEDLNSLFLQRIKKSYEIYTNAPRSNEKLKPIHSFIAEVLQDELGEDYVIKSEGFRESKEQKVSGLYYDKDVDISVLKNNEVLGSIAVKFICSNYSQNSNNYFENMLGETANLRRNDNFYAQLIILPEYVPYFKQGKVLDKIEYIKDHNLNKYLNLNQDSLNFPYCPDLISTILVNFNNEEFLMANINHAVNSTDLANSVNIQYSELINKNIKSKDVLNFLSKNGNFTNFINAFISKIKTKSFNF